MEINGFSRIRITVILIVAVAAIVGIGLFVHQSTSAQAQPAPATQPASAANSADAVTQVAVIITGGYATDARDHGRPVILIAAALNVPAETFRQAFSNVKPAPAGKEPDREQVKKNKDTLLKALAPFGVTNDRLDEVSNYYRYNRGKGEMWRNQPATAVATVRNGTVTRITITNPGGGYSSAPKVAIPSLPDVKLTVTISYNIDLTKNGSLAEIKEAKEAPAPTTAPANDAPVK